VFVFRSLVLFFCFFYVVCVGIIVFVWILNSYLQCAHLLLKFSPSRIVQVLPFERLRNYVLSILVCPLSRLYTRVCSEVRV